MTSERPSILATPSAMVRMVPVFFLDRLAGQLGDLLFDLFDDGAHGAGGKVTGVETGLDGKIGELAGDGGFVHIGADADTETGEQAGVGPGRGGDDALVALGHGALDHFREWRRSQDRRVRPRHVTWRARWRCRW